MGTPLRKRIVLLCIVLLAVLAFVVRGYKDERVALKSRDFKQPYSSARCLLKGCDPYEEAGTRAAYLAAGGIDNDKVVFQDYSALYPPFSLAVLTPVAALPYPQAHGVWEALCAASFAIAVLLIADLCIVAGAPWIPILLLAVFAFTSNILILLGQISGLVIGLLAIGMVCLIRGRWLWVAVVCLSAAVLLKPHDAALPLLYLLFAGQRWRRAFWAVGAISLVVVAGSLLWFAHMPHTAHWLPELQANLHGNAAPGSINSPRVGSVEAVNLADLRPLFALAFPNSYGLAALLGGLILLGEWATLVSKLANTVTKHCLAIAAIVCIALLPIYHRQYDTRILILVFPAIACLLARRDRRWFAWVGVALLAIATVFTTHTFLHRLPPASVAHAGVAKTLLLYRPLPEITLVLALYFLTALVADVRWQNRMARP